MEKRTSVFSNALIWFGAAVSIAEIITGTLFAPLGFEKGLLAIVIGHIIGGVLLFAAGVIGATHRRSAMETVKMSFGHKGAIFFVIINILQLVGWTAIMIYDGTIAANEVLNMGNLFWPLIIGGLIIVWIFIGISNLGKLNTLAMSLLFLLTLVLFKVIFFGNGSSVSLQLEEEVSFGTALELAIAMPLSWLPLISDYTKEAEKPIASTAASVVTYSVVSTFMYVIGMGASLYAGTGDIALIMVKAGMGVIGLLIIVFSTVTTTFLDAYSAGVSSLSISEKINAKHVAIVVTVIGMIGAMVYPMDNISPFLLWIGSVFAPMIAIQITDYFILRNDHHQQAINVKSAVTWVCGFVIYRFLLGKDILIGSTILDILITMGLCVVFEWVFRKKDQM